LKKILLIIPLIIFSCKEENSSFTTNEISLKSFNEEKQNLFSDDCYVAELNITELELIDSIIKVKNKCESNILGVLAAKRNYPDGFQKIKSKISGDTIETTSITNMIGEYQKEYYESITDSVVRVWTIQENKVVEIEKDSVRTIEKIKIKL
tara:strand:+ start:70 stop:522 length:453 start_codon:yes stop_codon:yes gene_type:complete